MCGNVRYQVEGDAAATVSVPRNANSNLGS